MVFAILQEERLPSTLWFAGTPMWASSRTGRSPMRSFPPTSWNALLKSPTSPASRCGLSGTGSCASLCWSWLWSGHAWLSGTVFSRQLYPVSSDQLPFPLPYLDWIYSFSSSDYWSAGDGFLTVVLSENVSQCSRQFQASSSRCPRITVNVSYYPRELSVHFLFAMLARGFSHLEGHPSPHC